MYIGVWPEYHLAKVVAAAEVSQANDQRLLSSAGGESQAGCETPRSTHSLPGLDALLQVPLCRRVDLHDEQNFRGRASSFDIGPLDLAKARQQHHEYGQKGEARRLPPLPRHTGRAAPNRILRQPPSKVPTDGQRAHSQPRLFQPPIPESKPEASRRSSSPLRSLSQTPPMQGWQTPPAPCPSHRSRGLPSSAPPDVSIGAPQMSSNDTARGHSLPPPPPLLPKTPPWRKKSFTPPPPVERGRGPPSWISEIRAQVENTRELFMDNPPCPRKTQELDKVKTSPVAEKGYQKGVITSDTEVITPAREQIALGKVSATTATRMPASEIEEIALEKVSVTTATRVPASEIEEVIPVVQQATKLAKEAHQPKTLAMEEDDDDDVDELIAWSQGLCLADFHKTTEPGDALAAALAGVTI